MNRLLKNTILGGLSTLLFFISIACSSAQPVTSQPTSVREQQIQKEERAKPYLNNLTGYKEIPADEWLANYPAGLILMQNSEVYKKLEGKTLVPERVMVGDHYGSVKEYVKFNDTKTGDVYFATIDALTGITEDVDSSTEINERIKNNEPELFATVVTSIENNKSSVPEVEKIIGSENPYAVGTALHHVSKDIQIIDFANGEVSPFLGYSARLNSDKSEFEFSGVPESATTYFLMRKLGINYTIPFVEKELGMVVGEKITEGKLWESPLGTKTNVKISYQPGSDTMDVSGRFGDSVITRVTKYTYYSIKAGEALKPEEVPSPLEGLKFDTSVNPEETLRGVGEYIAKKNSESEERQKTQQGTKFSEDVKERISDTQKKAEEEFKKRQHELQQQQEKAKQQADELKRKAEEETKRRADELREQIRRQQEETQRKIEEQKRRLEKDAERAKEKAREDIQKAKEGIGDWFKKKK